MLLLGIIQGISEILPVSSSINLHVLSSICDIKELTLSLKIALHFGSLITLLVYFRSEIIDILKAIFGKKRLSETGFWQLVCGTIPVVIFGYLARDYVKEFDSSKIMGICSIIFGTLLFVFDKLSCKTTRSKQQPVSKVKSFAIGCFQAVSVIPGISRLGICITASRMMGLDRPNAIHFSLLLAIPSILGSIALESYKRYSDPEFSRLMYDAWPAIIVTVIAGLLAVIPCIKMMERHGFLAIAAYRIVMGIIVCLSIV
jgi:undecaprenyl-diphosphatase